MRLFSCLWMLVIFSCTAGSRITTSDETEKNHWDRLKADDIYRKALNYIGEEKPQHAVDGLTILVEKFPDYPKNSDALLSMGRIYCDQFREFDNAIACYTKLIERYPANPLTAQAYFMKGFIYSNYFQQFDSAKTYYHSFLKKYPNHELAPSVQFELDNMGKDIEITVPVESDTLSSGKD
ncbi:tetratricopeptide repeat protein [bacterium]|nr:tetratricopeptide repeat protein [bacterium]